MKSTIFFILSLTLFSCKPEKINENSLKFSEKALEASVDKRHKEAINFATQAINSDENNFNAYTIKAQMLIKEQKYNEAEIVLNKLLKINPKYEEGWTLKGIVNDMNNKPLEAITSYKKAISIFEENDGEKEYRDTNIYILLILIGDIKSKNRMREIEKKYDDNMFLIFKNISKKEIIENEFLFD